MRLNIVNDTGLVLLLFLAVLSVPSAAAALDSSGPLRQRDLSDTPLYLDYGPSPPPDEGPPASADALRDPRYLPAEIGGIVGSYALSLVAVATALLCLAKRRRDHLRGADEEFEYPALEFPGTFVEVAPGKFEQFPYPVKSPRSPVPNFSYPDPQSPTRTGADLPQYVFPSPVSTAPGIDFHVDQNVVARDHVMAQQQLEDMYKHVMEQEAAKAAGVEYHGPPLPAASIRSSSQTSLTQREKNKPSRLNLAAAGSEKTQSRTSSILSALRSPRKKGPKGLSISSPILTPMSGTFSHTSDAEEMGAISPRFYAPPPPPPPVPATSQAAAPGSRSRRNTGSGSSLPTMDTSPKSTQSIDERIAAAPLPTPRPRVDTFPAHMRDTSMASSAGGGEPNSALSDNSTTPLVGLPTSPRPGVNRFPSLAELPKSPVPGQSFPRVPAPQQGSAVRANGSLPLRAYEPGLASPSNPSFATHNISAAMTKQTVFERKTPGPMSPSGSRTPWTGAPVPYSPYQPFSPVVPITPSLVTKEDRRRMRKMEPKTPTLAMVKSDDDVW